MSRLLETSWPTCGWFDRLNKLPASRQIDGWTGLLKCFGWVLGMARGSKVGQTRVKGSAFELQSSQLDAQMLTDTFRSASTADVMIKDLRSSGKLKSI